MLSEAMNQVTIADMHTEFTKLHLANPLKDHMKGGRKLRGMGATKCIGDRSQSSPCNRPRKPTGGIEV